MKEPEKVPFDSMPPLVGGSFLTKEQLEKLKEPFKDVVLVVHCKDCKHYHKGFNCDLLQKPIMKGDDWFCADGVAKDINVPDKKGR